MTEKPAKPAPLAPTPRSVRERKSLVYTTKCVTCGKKKEEGKRWRVNLNQCNIWFQRDFKIKKAKQLLESSSKSTPKSSSKTTPKSSTDSDLQNLLNDVNTMKKNYSYTIGDPIIRLRVPFT